MCYLDEIDFAPEVRDADTLCSTTQIAQSSCDSALCCMQEQVKWLQGKQIEGCEHKPSHICFRQCLLVCAPGQVPNATYI